MPRLEIYPFSDEHLQDAARLLSVRHQRHRAAEPLLPGRFEDPAAAIEELEAAWHADQASGSVAFRDGRLVGYLLAAPRGEAEVWGENVWIELGGHAVQEPEDLRDLYAAAAARWVDEGRRRHYALVPASDEALVDSWFRLGFGQQQAQGVREVPADTQVYVPDGFEIRKPTADDVDELLDVDLALPKHMRSSPIFGGRPLPTAEEIRDEWAKTLAGDQEEVLIGCRGGKPVACWALVMAPRSERSSGLGDPERACYLAFAATLPDVRGSGIGVALTDASFAWAADAGYETMVTDWRVTNLLASRFWPRRGFRTSFLRLYRHIP
jgi:ribosomal protein S18 acetylase RimI-like enzyme